MPLFRSWPAALAGTSSTVLAALLCAAPLLTLPVQARENLQDQAPQMNLPRLALQAGMHRIDAQVANTPEQHSKGLMFRKNMPAHEGMLFVFERATPQCFWMRNTPLPLSIAFLRDDGVIVNIAEMRPLSDQSHCSAQPVRYVLEMNMGWFSAKGLKAGDQISGLR